MCTKVYFTIEAHRDLKSTDTKNAMGNNVDAGNSVDVPAAPTVLIARENAALCTQPYILLRNITPTYASAARRGDHAGPLLTKV